MEEIDTIKQMFRYYDTDTDGHLTRDEASTLYRELGYTGGNHWAQKRVPLEAFLLKCGLEKKAMLESTSSLLEYRSIHTSRLLDQPRTGTTNAHKLQNYLKELNVEIEEKTVERIAEIISTSDEAEFTEEDLVEYISANLRMGMSMANSMSQDESSLESGGIS
ncbi:hypothetical protein TL16_g10350 [Triparma laevis f. inornata]|uniref:EF-hand domain-containing protein n=2 Tax=Triparma laevis TaxID=1534972 RepID=A0A9W7F2F4_9STRA|nr:hypothetical protein TL16_g10350 [Triparma laevis f. inornata]GMI01150.1 hypothetical protein TrLO_g3846 [Triparma laevis f. longispina]